MEEQNRPANPRRRRRKPTFKDYLPLIVLATVALIAVICVVFAVLSLVKHFTANSSAPSAPTTLQTGPSASSSSTLPTRPTQPTTKPQSQIDEEIDALIAQADKVAAGYDYDKAIEMLKNSEYFGESTKLGERIVAYTRTKGEMVRFPLGNNVTHVFFHSLIVDTSRAFDGDEDSGGYNMYMTTVSEFEKMLQEMYERGFVLVSPYDVAYEYTDENGEVKFKKGDIYLPSGKKPLLISQDDLNYYSYMVGTGNGKNETPIFADTRGDGFAHRIVIGEDGYPTCEYMDKDGNITTGDYDLVPVLEKFIQAHPDFSYRGARAILGMTGYEGVFGYRTKPGYNVENGGVMSMEDWNAEVEQAKAVAQCLRDHGWILASHSYGHPRYGDLTPERVETDSTKWENTVQSIIGDTDVILFPHGSDIGSWRGYEANNEKFQILYEDGYRYFFNVDNTQYWNQYGANYFRGGRRNLDGFRMYYYPDQMKDLFDVEDVWDDSRPTPVPQIGNGM